MNTYQIKRLVAIGAIAFLPIACGTRSPIGPDVAAIEAEATVSASTTGPERSPYTPSPDRLPASPVTIEVPSAPTRPDAPVPPLHPSPEKPAECLAASVEIVAGNIFGGTNGVELEAVLQDRNGRAITDRSCDSMEWADGGSDRQILTFAYGKTTQFVTVTGPAGKYTIVAVTPNGLRAELSIGLAGPGTEIPIDGCLAASVEILQRNLFEGANGAELEAVLMDSNGRAITDSACDKVLWADGGSGGADLQILTFTYGKTTQFVTVTGPAGVYTIVAVTPSRQRAELVITLR